MRDSPKFFLPYIMIHVKFNQIKMPVIESKCLRWLLIFHTTVINFLFVYLFRQHRYQGPYEFCTTELHCQPW